MASSNAGYLLLGIGVFLLVLTFILGFMLYQSISAGNTQASNVSLSGNNPSQTFTSAMESIVSNVDSNVYTLIMILILFVFANIGYKIGLLGINIIGKSESTMQQTRQSKA